MYRHEPSNYKCPFCPIIQAGLKATPDSVPKEIIYSSEMVTAFLALGRWAKNPVDVLVVPNAHFENIYDLPTGYALLLHELTRAVALALKGVYGCEGISMRQHNEPAGDQDVWHYHVHVTPRFSGDNFYKADKVDFPEAERLREAQVLREYMKVHKGELFSAPDQSRT